MAIIQLSNQNGVCHWSNQNITFYWAIAQDNNSAYTLCSLLWQQARVTSCQVTCEEHSKDCTYCLLYSICHNAVGNKRWTKAFFDWCHAIWVWPSLFCDQQVTRIGPSSVSLLGYQIISACARQWAVSLRLFTFLISGCLIRKEQQPRGYHSGYFMKIFGGCFKVKKVHKSHNSIWSSLLLSDPLPVQLGFFLEVLLQSLYIVDGALLEWGITFWCL